MSVLVRCASHRARHTLFRLLEEKPQGYYSWKTYATGGFWEIPEAVLAKALTITGITKASKRFQYYECWNA